MFLARGRGGLVVQASWNLRTAAHGLGNGVDGECQACSAWTDDNNGRGRDGRNDRVSVWQSMTSGRACRDYRPFTPVLFNHQGYQFSSIYRNSGTYFDRIRFPGFYPLRLAFHMSTSHPPQSLGIFRYFRKISLASLSHMPCRMPRFPFGMPCSKFQRGNVIPMSTRQSDVRKLELATSKPLRIRITFGTKNANLGADRMYV